MNPPDVFIAESAIIAGKFLSEEEGRSSAPTAGGRLSVEPTLRTFHHAGAEDAEDAGRGARESNPMKIYAKVALYSCLFNGILAAAKYFLGETSGSMALKADAVHSLADVVSSFSILAGILISDRKTKTFPLGLYKVENLVALLSSIFIFFAAYEIIQGAMVSAHRTAIVNIGPAAGGIVLILSVAYLYSRYELKAGLEAGSPSLVADAKHIGADMLSSFIILAAILGTYIGIHLDRYVAVLVAALVVYSGFTIMADSIKVLLDATLDYSTLDGIRDVLKRHPSVMQVSSLGGRSSGRYKFVEANLKLDSRLLREAHNVVSDLEEQILDRWPEIDTILIHYEPEQKEYILIAVPLHLPQGASPGTSSMLAEHFGKAPFFALLRKEARTGDVVMETVIENRFCSLERHRGVKAAELLADAGVDEVRGCGLLDGRGAGYALEALGIGFFTTHATTLSELMSEIAENHDWKEVNCMNSQLRAGLLNCFEEKQP